MCISYMQSIKCNQYEYTYVCIHVCMYLKLKFCFNVAMSHDRKTISFYEDA